MTPKYSIIVPNYNHSRFLQQRLESIFNQTFQDFEVILLDDASTDNSGEVLRNFQDHPKVSHFHINQENSGNPFRQWKKGISLAKGKFIWIAESDDFCELNFLEILNSKLLPSTVLIYSASQVVNEKNEKLGLFEWAQEMSPLKWSQCYTNQGKKEVDEYLRFRNTIPNASAVVFKKEVINNIDFPDNMFYCGDWYIWLQIICKGNISYVHKFLNYFRAHKESTRSIKSPERETRRFREYFFIIRKTSTLSDQILYQKKYDWILLELSKKEKYLGSFFFLKINMPFFLLYRYLTKQKIYRN